MPEFGCSLSTLTARAKELKELGKVDMRVGDHVLVRTCNSLYAIRVLENGHYLVSGGWFDRKGLSPMKTTIAGCTWGSSVIKLDIIAACGLCLEFGNRLVTSTIRSAFVLPYGSEN